MVRRKTPCPLEQLSPKAASITHLYHYLLGSDPRSEVDATADMDDAPVLGDSTRLKVSTRVHLAGVCSEQAAILVARVVSEVAALRRIYPGRRVVVKGEEVSQHA